MISVFLITFYVLFRHEQFLLFLVTTYSFMLCKSKEVSEKTICYCPANAYLATMMAECLKDKRIASITDV